ncbi:MAG TPA: substrate-binding domain-containing protein [Armatimonadota bacterium]|jgi:DNA-binding LacI/PurR family transcriptional regulator
MSASVNKESPLPRYIQARRYLEEMIRDAPYGPGDQLPSERELAARFQVSQMTMNRAIQEMVRDGLLYREVGRGTFVVHQDARDVRFGTLALVTLFSPGAIKTDPYGSEILRGVQDAAFDTDWDLLLIQEALDTAEDIAMRVRERADGFLIMSPPDEALPALRRMRAEGLPFLTLGASWLDEDIPAVDSDNIVGASLAVDHLASLGHERIGFIGGPEDMSNSLDRHVGFKRSLKDRGLPYRTEWCFGGEAVSAISAEDRARIVSAARRADGPTAFFAAGFVLAALTIETLQMAGLDVPGDVSVVGFDETVGSAFINPPLTTVAQPLGDMGRRAVERMESALRGESNSHIVERLPVRFIARQSTAAPVAR